MDVTAARGLVVGVLQTGGMLLQVPTRSTYFQVYLKKSHIILHTRHLLYIINIQFYNFNTKEDHSLFQ